MTGRSRPRNWSKVNEKRRQARFCAACGRSDRPLEAAHLIGRARDAAVVDPDEVTFLCGRFPAGCHGDYDRHVLDLYPHLTDDELRGAIRAAGSPGAALRRLSAPLWRSGRSADVRTLDERLAALIGLAATL